MILQAGRTDWVPVRKSAPIYQLADFFHGRPGLLRLVGTPLLKFVNLDEQSKKLPSNHPEVVAFKILEWKKKVRQRVYTFKEWLWKWFTCKECKADKTFFQHLTFALCHGVLILGLAIGVLAITASKLDCTSSGICDAADSLKLCMADLDLHVGHNCSNGTYTCGGMLPNNSSNMSSANTTFVARRHE